MTYNLSFNPLIESDTFDNTESRRSFEESHYTAKKLYLTEVQWLANKMNIERILENDHPRAQALYDWIISDDKITEWYLKNNDKIRLVPGWIEILWDIYDLEDTIENKVIYYGLFTMNYAEKLHLTDENQYQTFQKY